MKLDIGSIKIFRIGDKTDNASRPLRVILPSASVAKVILKNAHKKISYCDFLSDRSKIERNHQRFLWASVDKFEINGVNKTIKFINGKLKIVDCDDDDMSIVSPISQTSGNNDIEVDGEFVNSSSATSSQPVKGLGKPKGIRNKNNSNNKNNHKSEVLNINTEISQQCCKIALNC